MTNPFFVGIGQKDQTEERTITGKKKIFSNRMPFKIENNDVLIMGENNQTVVRIFIETEKEKAFLKRFYGI